MVIKKNICEVLLDKEFLQEMLSSYLYLPKNIEYEELYTLNKYTNLSFALELNNVNVAMVMLTKDSGELGFFGRPLDVLISKKLNSTEQFLIDSWIRSYFENLIKENEISSISFYPYPPIVDLFCSYGLKSHFQLSSYVNLKLSEDQIKKSIRKSYRSLINWGRRELVLKEINNKNLNFEMFDEFRKFHIRVAGRETRSSETWNMQYELIKEGKAFVILGFLGERLVSGVLTLHGSREAYYAVAVNDRELMAENKPLAHFVINQSILRAKELSLETYNLGEIANPEFNDKEMAIAKFKKGFTSTVKVKPYLSVKF